MTRELEVRIGTRIDQAFDRLRSRVYRMGMAGKWHIGRASELIQKPELVQRDVEPLSEPDQVTYLEQLPHLIAKVQEQDQRVAELWDESRGLKQENRFLVEREELVRLFPLFRFRPKLYERLVRQPDKPFFNAAIRLLNTGEESSSEAIALERTLRMPLRDFVLLEGELSSDFRDLDEAREELCKAHQTFALKIASSQPHSDEATITSALAGLWRAASWYDFKNGYSFEEYAQHWVKEAIEKGKM